MAGMPAQADRDLAKWWSRSNYAKALNDDTSNNAKSLDASMCVFTLLDASNALEACREVLAKRISGEAVTDESILFAAENVLWMRHLVRCSGIRAVEKWLEKWSVLWGWALMEAAQAFSRQGRNAGDVTVARLNPTAESDARARATIKHLRGVLANTSANPRLATASTADEGEYQPASWFGKSLAGRLRMASGPRRKTKRVRVKKIDGVNFYSVADAKCWWGRDVKNQ